MIEAEFLRAIGVWEIDIFLEGNGKWNRDVFICVIRKCPLLQW